MGFNLKVLLESWRLRLPAPDRLAIGACWAPGSLDSEAQPPHATMQPPAAGAHVAPQKCPVRFPTKPKKPTLGLTLPISACKISAVKNDAWAHQYPVRRSCGDRAYTEVLRVPVSDAGRCRSEALCMACAWPVFGRITFGASGSTTMSARVLQRLRRQRVHGWRRRCAVS